MNVPDYREILKDELLLRCKNNSLYSLRSFARFLMMEPGQLSRVINRKKNISLATARLIAERLFTEEKRKNLFLDLVEYNLAKKEQAKELAYKRIAKKLRNQPEINLQLDALEVISNWYHLPILELSEILGTDFKSTKVAFFLGISEIEARSAIGRLISVGLLKKNGESYQRTHTVLNTATDIPSKYIRQFHQQMISKSLASVEGQSVDERYLRGKTISIAKKDLPKFKELVEEFMSQVTDLNENSKRDKDSVYQINLQMFDLKNRGSN
jgi:uncharacterized protein (TIGR02147 family)